MNLRHLFSFFLSLIFTAIFLAIALSSVDFAKLISALISADYRLVFVAAIFTTIGYVLRTARWQRLLAPAKKISLARLFPVLVVGFAMNNLLPGRPGEFARPYWLGRREGLSRTLGFGTIVVERVADGLTLIAFLAIALTAYESLGLDLPDLAEKIALVAAIAFGIDLFALIFLLVREQLALAILQSLTRFLPQQLSSRIHRMLTSFVVGLHSLRSLSDVMSIALLSIAVWGIEGVSYFLVLSAFGVLPFFSLRTVGSVATMALINLGIMIPAAPGGLGPYEAAGVFALSTLQVNETSAASIALTSHSMQYLLITGLGLILAWREGLLLIQNREDDADARVGEGAEE